MDHDERPFRRLRLGIGQRSVLIGVFALLVVIVVCELSLGKPAATVIGAVIAPFAALGIYRTARAGVVIDQDGVTSRTVEWSSRIRWCDVSAVTLAHAPKPAVSVMLTTHHGRQLFLRGIAGFPTSANADRLDDVACYMQQVKAYHEARCSRCAELTPPAAPSLGDGQEIA